MSQILSKKCCVDRKMRSGVECSFNQIVSLFPNIDFFRRRQLFQVRASPVSGTSERYL